jgi:hypothetical protein
MNYRQIGKTDLKVSELSFGTWAIGGSWGTTDDQESLSELDFAMDNGVNFLIPLMYTAMAMRKNCWRKRQKASIARFMWRPSFAGQEIFLTLQPIRWKASAATRKQA